MRPEPAGLDLPGFRSPNVRWHHQSRNRGKWAEVLISDGCRDCPGRPLWAAYFLDSADDLLSLETIISDLQIVRDWLANNEQTNQGETS